MRLRGREGVGRRVRCLHSTLQSRSILLHSKKSAVKRTNTLMCVTMCDSPTISTSVSWLLSSPDSSRHCSTHTWRRAMRAEHLDSNSSVIQSCHEKMYTRTV
jgi:hypothetical protein